MGSGWSFPSIGEIETKFGHGQIVTKLRFLVGSIAQITLGVLVPRTSKTYGSDYKYL